MKNEKNNININPESMRELTPEELEQINAGGIREITAAVTLAAMTLTGAGNIAATSRALAEENRIEEAAPHEVTFGLGEEETVMASDAMDIMYAQAQQADGLSIQAEQAVSEDDVIESDAMESAGAVTSDEAVPMEAEALMVADGLVAEGETTEAPAVAPAEDRQAMMADMINDTIRAHRTEGLYAALDETFATLAENAGTLANPETGVIETDGNAIVNTTYDALSDNFNYAPEELMGAIAAAAARADARGALQTLGGDPMLTELAATNSTADQLRKNTAKYGKILYDSYLDAVGIINPNLKPYMTLFKGLGGEVFGLIDTKSDPNAAILYRLSEMDQKLDEIQQQITQSESALKAHSYNVISLAMLGNESDSVMKTNETVRTYIGDFMNDQRLSDAQKLQKLADMYKDPKFTDLVAAVEGATLCFTSSSNSIFRTQNVFEAAYNRACEEVMFSGEAIDLATPYLFEQLKILTEACATMNQVYDAYEAVYGAGSINVSREKMNKRLTGCDRNNNKVQKSVFECFNDYLGKDRHVFVNRSNNTNIKVDKTLWMTLDFGKVASENALYDQDHVWAQRMYVGANPLSADHVKSLAAYCKARNITLWEFLFDDMGFNLAVKGENGGELKAFDTRQMPSPNGNYYLATGAQHFTEVKYKKSVPNYEQFWCYFDCINACRVGAENEHKEMRYVDSADTHVQHDNRADAHMIFFRPRSK